MAQNKKEASPKAKMVQIRHAAEELGCSIRHVRNLIDEGILEAVDISTTQHGSYRIERAVLEKFKKERSTLKKAANG